MLFRGNAEARIRENLLKQGYIKGIIGLPANLFYGTSIPACIIVIDKESAHSPRLQCSGWQWQGLFMIDASKGFIKDGNKNRLREQDIHKIVDTFTRGLTLEVTAVGTAWRDRPQRLQPQYPALYRWQRRGRPARSGRSPARGIPERDIAALGPTGGYS